MKDGVKDKGPGAFTPKKKGKSKKGKKKGFPPKRSAPTIAKGPSPIVEAMTAGARC